MKHLFYLTALMAMLYSCSGTDQLSNQDKEKINKEVHDMFDQYHAAIAKSGLTSEFDYLDDSEDFFWVPPGYNTTLNFDSVKSILEESALSFQTVKFHWETLSVFPISSSIANYSGTVKGVMTDTAGVDFPVAIIESGTVIKRETGWKLLSGQSTALTEIPTISEARVTGIGGIFFKANNPKEMKEWYYENLGLVRNDYGSIFEYLRSDGSQRKAYLQWSPFSDQTTYFEPSTKPFMINYRVENMEALVEQLKVNGVTVVDQIETYEYGKFVHILDPENNKIELWEPVDNVFTRLYDGATTK